MKLKIATRSSLLAMTQSKFVAAQLQALAGTTNLEIEFIEIKTGGDKKQGTVHAGFGDKKDWVYELEVALLTNVADVAIHSAKDVPGNIEPGLSLMPVTNRESPYDLFIGKKVVRDGVATRKRLADLDPNSATIGTASLRRKASIKNRYPNMTVVDHRGNIPTRVQRLDESETLDGIILAASGVKRINLLESSEYDVIEPSVMLPAMNQGILCAQYRSGDEAIVGLLQRLSSPELMACFFAEREVARMLGGDCRSAISILALPLDDQKISVSANVFSSDAGVKISASRTGQQSESLAIATQVAHELIAQNAFGLLGIEP